jgi:hypothetical protein
MRYDIAPRAYDPAPNRQENTIMTVCPIAIAVGCKKCPAFSVCPLKGVLGDQPQKEDPPAAKAESSTSKKK